jgi:hypothetical protein
VLAGGNPMQPIDAEPGLHTTRDLPLPSFFPGR